MNRDDIIKLGREAGFRIGPSRSGPDDVWGVGATLERFAFLVAAAEREKVAKWMIQRSYATGHGDTIEDLLAELDWQIAENWNRAMIKGIETEREACIRECEIIADFAISKGEVQFADRCAAAIRARGQG